MKRLSVGFLVIMLLIGACSQKSDTVSQETQNTAAEALNNDETVDTSSLFDSAFGAPDVINMPSQSIAAGDGTLFLNVAMPYGYKLNESAPFTATIMSDNANVTIAEEWANYQEITPVLPVAIPVTLTEGETTITAELRIYWCEAINQTLCFVDDRLVNVPLIITSEAAADFVNADVLLIPPDSAP